MSYDATIRRDDPFRRIPVLRTTAILICLALTLVPDLSWSQNTGRGARAQPPAQTPAASAQRSRTQAAHAAACGSVPQRFREREYGPALHALEVSCPRELSPEEQVFMAGLAQGLVQECGFPTDPRDRARLLTFLTASGWVGAAGADYSAPNLPDGLASQAASTTAYSAGEAASRAAGCTPLGRVLAQGVVAYLDRTSASTRFVEGCASYYEGRYTLAQCQCVADVFRVVEPSIYSQAFSRDVFPYISRKNPFVGLQGALQCGIGSY